MLAMDEPLEPVFVFPTVSEAENDRYALMLSAIPGVVQLYLAPLMLLKVEDEVPGVVCPKLFVVTALAVFVPWFRRMYAVTIMIIMTAVASRE